MNYGDLPKELGVSDIDCKEMLFYQYLPVKLMGEIQPIYEPRLSCFDSLVGQVCCDFIGEFGLDKYVNSNIYLTAKSLFISNGKNINRAGYHADGFMTDDINYIWSDKFPTIFNTTKFNLSLNDSLSLNEMELQALKGNEVIYPPKTLLRLNQFNIHKCAEITEDCIRTFVKVSFSKDKYDLIGNSRNYLLDYNWEMKPRKTERNIPQSVIK